MVAEAFGVGGVHRRVVVDAVEQHCGLDDVRERAALGFEQRGHVGQRLANLGVETVDECSIDNAELAGDVDRVSGANCWGVRRLGHVRQRTR